MTLLVAPDRWAPHVLRTVQTVQAQFPRVDIGTYPGHSPSEALAADFFVPDWRSNAGIKLGDALAQSLASEAVAKKWGIWYVIWRGRIWSMTRPGAGWLNHADRNSTNASKAHKDHVHVSWYAEEPEPEYLPPYAVGAHPVWAIKVDGDAVVSYRKREPGYPVTTGLTIDGGYLVTASGYLYPYSMLIPQEG